MKYHTDFQALTAPLLFADTGCASSNNASSHVCEGKEKFIDHTLPPQFVPLPLA
jgi:hypothetical protein